MLRNVKEHLDFDIGRIYMDRQMYQTDIVKLCRGYGLNWMIQAPMKGEAKRLAKEAEQGEPKPDSDFDGLELNQKVNAFAYPSTKTKSVTMIELMNSNRLRSLSQERASHQKNHVLILMKMTLHYVILLGKTMIFPK